MDPAQVQQIALDVIMRVVTAEAIKAIVWGSVFAVFYAILSKGLR